MTSGLSTGKYFGPDSSADRPPLFLTFAYARRCITHLTLPSFNQMLLKLVLILGGRKKTFDKLSWLHILVCFPMVEVEAPLLFVIS